MKFIKDIRFANFIWATLIFVCILLTIILGKGNINNFLIFKGVFHHTIAQTSLYDFYPSEYGDKNHYGILFSAIIAPFAIFPTKIGCTLWIIANALFLYWAIRQLPLSKMGIITVLLVSAHDIYAAVCMQQFNPSVIALIVLSFVFIRKKQEHWATLCIVIGAFVKIYGIVGLAFFFFSERKLHFILWGIFWSVVAFCFPMLYASPDFVISQYKEWFLSLQHKNEENLITHRYNLQNISLIGFFQRTELVTNTKWLILSGLALFVLPYFRIFKLENLKIKLTEITQSLDFQLLILASVSIFLVLFSTGSENSTYIVAFVGVGIWFSVSQLPHKIKLILFVLVIISSFLHTDLVPKFIKWNFVVKYSLRAVAPAILWLSITYELLTRNFQPKTQLK